MEPSARSVLSFSCAIVVAVLSIASRAEAQDETISGNLTVEGRADLLMGPLSLGTSSFYDELDDETTAEGLTIHYSETSQVWSGGNFVQGRSTIVQRVGQELADFYWQTSEPDGLGGFTAVDLMKLSNEQLLVQPSILGQGTLNLLPNQTLSGGNGSILTLGLADNRYLSNAGGTIAGNLTITGSDVTINGSKVLTEADEGYIKYTPDGRIVTAGASVTEWTGGIGLGGGSTVSGYQAIAIGNWSFALGDRSVALGRDANASANVSIAIGYGPYAGGQRSIVIGHYAGSYAEGSIAIGQEAKTTQKGQVVLGNFNETAPYSPDNALPNDWLFSLGNGTADNARSNALVVRRNGDMEVMGTSLTVNGNQVLTEASGDTRYLKAMSDPFIFVYGEQAEATAWTQSFAIGYHAKAGANAISIGGHAGDMGSGIQSVALGYVARALGNSAVALGYEAYAGGADSLAILNGSATRTDRTIAIGKGVEATRPGQVALGNYNVYDYVAHTSSPGDQIFVIGNGTADDARSNALVVKRNGDMEVKGTSLTVNGNEVLTQADALTTYVTQTVASTNFIAKDAVDSQLPNQVAGHVNSILTKGIADGLYLSSGSTAGISFKFGSETIATSEHSIVLGHRAKANTNAISIGSYASDMGGNMASGIESVALGYVARAPGDRGVALGYATWAGGADSVSIMNGSAARMDRTIAIGKGVEATCPGQVALGNYNLFEYLSETSSPGDPIFVIGNGTADNARSNALMVKRNGNMEVMGNLSGVGGLTMQGTDNRLPNQVVDHVDSIMTKGVADGLYLSSGSLAGIIFKFGSETIAMSEHSIVLGHHAKANTNAISIGSYASDIGGTMASGAQSVALGHVARAPGNGSIGIGTGSFADGETSLSLGQETGAFADRSIAIGRGALAYLPGQIAIGNYNIFGNATQTAGQSDPLFILGNGTDDNARSNALVVRRNGDMEVKGTSLTVNGNEVLTEAGALTTYVTQAVASTNFIAKDAVDSQLPNQVADHVNSILTKGIADSMYLSVGNDAGISFRFGQDAVATNNLSIAIGHGAKANANAVSIGSYASNMGDNMASGTQSVALGYVARAPGDGAIGMGTSSLAAGETSLSLGQDTGAYTDRSIAIGRGSLAYLPGQVAIGNYNILGNVVHTVWQYDPIFIIGNGTADNARSNALVVRRNGDMEVMGTSLTVNGEAVLTEAALDAAIETVNLGGGNYLSKNPLIGLTYGTNTTAAAHSMAMGEESVASGTLSSSAIGYDTLANQSGTHALGNYLVANRPGQIVLGNYNDFGLDSAGSATADPADAIFVIGNGSADNARSNALVIKRGGDIALQGTSLTYNGAGLLTQASADTLYLSQSQATANYLTVAAAAAAYQTKPAMGIDFLTSEDLVTIQASIEAKIDEAELEAALENIDLSGNYLSSDPQVGLAYGTGSSAVAASSSAIGDHVEANMTGQVVVGRYNKVETASNPPTEDDPVFVVGVGNGIPEDEGERKNAVVVKRNGDVNVTGGVLRVMPAGDLSMDGFTSGPTPIDLE